MMKAHEKRTFAKYPQLLIGRYVYFETSKAVKEAIAAREVLDLIPNKPYKIIDVESYYGQFPIVRFKDEAGYKCLTSIEKSTCAHLANIASFKLYHAPKQRK